MAPSSRRISTAGRFSFFAQSGEMTMPAITPRISPTRIFRYSGVRVYQLPRGFDGFGASLGPVALVTASCMTVNDNRWGQFYSGFRAANAYISGRFGVSAANVQRSAPR